MAPRWRCSLVCASMPLISCTSVQRQVALTRAPRVRRSTLEAMGPAIIPVPDGVRRV
ncbi:hypothetical protein D3C72_1091620 [compost metagenome]